MRRNPSIIATLIICGVFMASCATINIPKKTTNDDCLIVVPSKRIAPVGVDAFRDYELVFSANYPPVTLAGNENGVTAFIIKEPGVQVTAIRTKISSVHSSSVTGNSGEYKVNNVVLPYAPGKMIVTDFTFMQEYKLVSSSSYTTSINFRKTEDAEKSILIQKLRAHENFANWEN